MWKLLGTMYCIVNLNNIYTTTVRLLGRLRYDLHMGDYRTAGLSWVGFEPEVKIPKQYIGKFEYHAFKSHAVKNSLFG